MSDAPKGRPLSGTAAGNQQPTVEWKIKKTKELVQTLEHLGVRAPVYLLQLVDPASFVKPSVTMPKKGTAEWDAVKKVVNSGPILELLLERLGFLSNLPGGGKLVKSTIPFDYEKKGNEFVYSKKRKQAIDDARKKIQDHKQIAPSLSPEAAAEIVAFADAQSEALEMLIQRQDEAKKTGKADSIDFGRYEFIDEDVVAGMQKLQAKGYDVKYAAALHAFLDGDFNAEVVPALKRVAEFIRIPIEQATEQVSGIPQDKLALVKEFATYILGRVAEDHDTENQQWQAQLARSVVIFWSYGLAKGDLVESKDGEVKQAKIDKANAAGERFLQFVYAYMTSKDPSKFPSDTKQFPHIMEGIEQGRMPSLINPVHLLIGQMQLPRRIPTSPKDIADFRANDDKRVAERASRMTKERALLDRLHGDKSISFTTGLANYTTLRHEYERGYESKKLSVVVPVLAAISEMPTAADVQSAKLLVEKHAKSQEVSTRSVFIQQPDVQYRGKRKEFSGLVLEGAKVKAMVAFAQQAVDPVQKRFAFAAARVMFHEAQETLKGMLRDVRRHKGDLSSSPVLHALAERAVQELAKAKDSLAVQANAINGFFKEFNSSVPGDWQDPKDTGYKLVRVSKVTKPKEGAPGRDFTADDKRSREGRKGHIGGIAKELLKRTDFENEMLRETKEKLTYLIRALKGDKDKNGKLVSPLHAINTLEAVASAITERAKSEQVSERLQKTAQALLLFANSLSQTHAEFKANGGRIQAKLPHDPGGILTVDTLEQIITSL